MPCFKPIKIRVNNGLRTFDQEVNCRRCTGCLIDRAAQWKHRMIAEKEMSEHDSFFTTNTYSNDQLPPNQELVLKHMQEFIAKIRRQFPKFKIRYVGKAEYGGQTYRPHYHFALFNLILTDLILYKKTDAGHKLYTSETINKIWGKGQVLIGFLDEGSAGYIANYLTKSDHIKGEIQTNDAIIDENGEIHERKQPFLTMSRRPGIGHKWIEKFLSDVFPSDQILVKNKQGSYVPVQPPEYYLKVLQKLDPEMHLQVLENRENNKYKKRENLKYNSTPERLRVREICLQAKLGTNPKKENVSV
jgi:hypothetical protein